jgi:hypothetical protein
MAPTALARREQAHVSQAVAPPGDRGRSTAAACDGSPARRASRKPTQARRDAPARIPGHPWPRQPWRGVSKLTTRRRSHLRATVAAAQLRRGGTQRGLRPLRARLEGDPLNPEFTGPRSPGWQPGDTGHGGHPAFHAARLQALPNFEPASHGPREGVRPGVPRLPPGAFWESARPGGPGRSTAGGGPPSEPRHEAAGSRERSSPASAGGFLGERQARRAGSIPRGRRPAKRTAARCRRFACIILPGPTPRLGPRPQPGDNRWIRPPFRPHRL